MIKTMTVTMKYMCNKKALVILLVIILVGTFLRLNNLGGKSFTQEEAQFWSWSQFDYLVGTIQGNTYTPASIFVFMMTVFRSWARSEAVLRSLAVFFGVLSIPAIYLLVKKLHKGETAALVAAGELPSVTERLPEGPAFYPDGELTDEPEEVLVAELIREAALEDLRDELPHSLAVVVDEMVPRADRPADRPLLDVRATLFVERSSQKPIVVGRGGERVKRVGSAARRHIESLLGTPVYLDLHVKVAKEWQRDPKQLRRLGF